MQMPYGIQQQLNILKDWLKTWHMKANMDKTKVVQFRPRTTRQSIANSFIDNANVIVTDSYTYLGVLLTQHMDYKLTAGQLARSASGAASKLISIYFENKGLPWLMIVWYLLCLCKSDMVYAIKFTGVQFDGF